MKPHKWAKEIKAWADGAEIEWKYQEGDDDEWVNSLIPDWHDDGKDFRIKPQPKEPQYLYVFVDSADWQATRTSVIWNKKDFETYIGKIKLETDDE